jgi:hypothetical protein
MEVGDQIHSSASSLTVNSVGIATGYGLDDRGSIPGRGKRFSLLPSVQTGSGVHPASYPVGTGALSIGVKRPGYDADHSPPTSAEVKNSGAIPLPPIRLHGVVINYAQEKQPYLPLSIG